jgi:hypothetical protein
MSAMTSHTIKNFEWAYNALVARWECKGIQIAKTYKFPIRSAVVLSDKTGVAIVEPFEEKGRNNAAVFNSDGTERFRLNFPLPEPHGNCFDQMYYICEKLTAIANLRGADFAYELNEQNGEVIRSYESK